MSRENPTIEEMAAACGVTPDQMREALRSQPPVPSNGTRDNPALTPEQVAATCVGVTPEQVRAVVQEQGQPSGDASTRQRPTDRAHGVVFAPLRGGR